MSLVGSPLDAFERLATEATALEETDPAGAARLWIEASTQAVDGGALDDAERAARTATLLAGRDDEIGAVAQANLAQVLIVVGRADEARVPLDESRAASTSLHVNALFRAGVALFWLGRYAEAETALEEAVDAARREPGAPNVALPLDTLAAIDLRLGRWARAAARSREALRLARGTGHWSVAASCLTTQARIPAARGEEREALALLDEARELADKHSLFMVYETMGRGFLYLSVGRPERAIEVLEPLRDEPLAGSSSVFPWLPDLVEAHVAVGRQAEAATLATSMVSRSDVEAPWPGAAVQRCLALAEPGDDAVRYFERALALHELTPMPFDRARTMLCYGERLRRLRRIREARPHLEAALAIFERLGARPWAQRAHLELDTTRRPAAFDEHELTARERAVVTLVRRGARNREIAAALYVTPKTVEHHLTRVYRKLGVRSRTELLASLGSKP